MRLEEKRRVIEALLCAGADDNNISCTEAVESVGCSGAAFDAVLEESYQRYEVRAMRFGHRLEEASYHLVESSATMRREWFGR